MKYLLFLCLLLPSLSFAYIEVVDRWESCILIKLKSSCVLECRMPESNGGIALLTVAKEDCR